MKYLFVTGGVMSGLGKGITAASIGRLLKSQGFEVTAIKIDPYLNVDAGTMSPFQHGEVYVLKDGGEVDLDLGNYERFLDVELTSNHNITTGKIYNSVIKKERAGKYLGRTVQIIPHITDEIKKKIRGVSEKSKADICIIEIGGTVGDIEGMPFLEAIRQLINEEGEENATLIHVTLVPILDVVGEQKTKPTQHSVKELRELGLHPDIIVGRCKEALNEKTRSKISLFCDIPKNAVISAHDANDIYEVPLILKKEEITEIIFDHLDLNPDGENLSRWKDHVESILSSEEKIKVALVGKYTDLEDSYMSVIEALKHATSSQNAGFEILWIDSEKLESCYSNSKLKEADGILVPGGFGDRGVKGKIEAIKYAREEDKPFLGLCFGFQLAVIEFARNVLGLEGANSTEVRDSPENPVIDLLPEQKNMEKKGGTMRLGNQLTILKEGTKIYNLYGKRDIKERHRHRYEVNPSYVDQFEERGLVFTGKDESGRRKEVLELENHKFFIGTQYHPEFKSRLEKPSPPFVGFVESMLESKNTC